ncbi:hypothetical protein BGZ46_006172 [Entomortierella lignicola]|nr:hypothetical protein BGZ46_006172 [Entomortierella lignicola]
MDTIAAAPVSLNPKGSSIAHGATRINKSTSNAKASVDKKTKKPLKNQRNDETTSHLTASTMPCPLNWNASSMVMAAPIASEATLPFCHNTQDPKGGHACQPILKRANVEKLAECPKNWEGKFGHGFACKPAIKQDTVEEHCTHNLDPKSGHGPVCNTK